VIGPVLTWGKAGQRCAAGSAMAEAPAQFQKALDQLTLSPDAPSVGDRARILKRRWRGVVSGQMFDGAGNGPWARTLAVRGELDLALRYDEICASKSPA